MKKKVVLLNVVIVFTLSVISLAAFAQEEELEMLLFEEIPIVISQGFFERKTTQSAGYATLISQEQIKNSPATTLADLINYYVPGVTTSYHEYSGPILGVRGVVVDSNAKTLVMLDGQHLNHRQHFGYSTELSVPLIGDIEKIEVVTGPGGIVHGSGAISGFVNLIPKTGSEHQGLATTVTYGYEDKLSQLELGYGLIFDDETDLYLYAGVVDADGAEAAIPWDTSNLGYIHEPWNPEGANALLEKRNKLKVFNNTYKTAAYLNSGNFKLNVFLRQENINTSGVLYGVDSPGGYTPLAHTASAGIRPKYVYELNDDDSLDLIGSLLWTEHAVYPSNDGSVLSNSLNNGINQGVNEKHSEFKLIYKTTRFEKQALALGGSLGKKTFEASKLIFGKDVEGSWEGNTGDWQETSVFAEDVVDITEKLVGSFGIRYDKAVYGKITTANYADIPDTTNTTMRIATAYEIDKDTNIKLSYQEGFRYLDLAYMTWWASTNDLIQSLGFDETLPAFKPETMTSTELTFSKSFPDKKLKCDITLFYNTYKHMLTWNLFSVENPAPLTADSVAAAIASQGWLGSHVNALGDFSSKGLETVINWSPLQALVFKLIYSYTVPDDVSEQALSSVSLFNNDGDEWIRYPKHMLKFITDYNLFEESLLLNLVLQYQTGIDRDNFNQMIAPVYGDNRFITDVAAKYIINDQLSVKLTVKNLFAAEEVPLTYKFLPTMGAQGDELRYIYLAVNYKFD